jgi:hypothetical protein
MLLAVFLIADVDEALIAAVGCLFGENFGGGVGVIEVVMPRVVKLMVSALYYTNARRMYYSFDYSYEAVVISRRDPLTRKESPT